jgi:hypothetical protein
LFKLADKKVAEFLFDLQKVKKDAIRDAGFHISHIFI